MSVNKRRLYDLDLVPKFENSPLAEKYEMLEEPFNSEQLQIGKEVAVLIEDDKQWVVGKVTNMKVQGCIWATVPNANPKSKAKAKQYVVCRIGSGDAIMSFHTALCRRRSSELCESLSTLKPITIYVHLSADADAWLPAFAAPQRSHHQA